MSRGAVRSGWLMMFFGWALAFFVLSWLYSVMLARQEAMGQHGRGAAELSVMFMQEGGLVLRENAAGQFMAQGTINGVQATLLVDTGAGQVALPQELAEQLGLEKKYAGKVHTAAGATEAWATDIEKLQIGGIIFRNIRGVILPAMEEQVVLLGMNALGKLHITQSGGELVLSAPKGEGVDSRRDGI